MVEPKLRSPRILNCQYSRRDLRAATEFGLRTSRVLGVRCSLVTRGYRDLEIAPGQSPLQRALTDGYGRCGTDTSFEGTRALRWPDHLSCAHPVAGRARSSVRGSPLMPGAIPSATRYDEGSRAEPDPRGPRSARRPLPRWPTTPFPLEQCDVRVGSLS